MAPAASAVEVMSSSRRESSRYRMTWISDSIGSRSHALLQAIVDGGADLPNRKAPALDPADLPQARRHYPRPRVLQLPRAGAEEGAGGPHRGARSLRFL